MKIAHIDPALLPFAANLLRKQQAGSTLLTAPESDEQRKRREAREAREREAEECAELVLQGLLEAYSGGELTFESMAQKARRALSVEHVRAFRRQMMLGTLIESALAITPKKRSRVSGRGRTTWETELGRDMVKLIREREGLPISRRAKIGDTAYEKAAAYLKLRGIHMSASAIERACSTR